MGKRPLISIGKQSNRRKWRKKEHNFDDFTLKSNFVHVWGYFEQTLNKIATFSVRTVLSEHNYIIIGGSYWLHVIFGQNWCIFYDDYLW